MHELAQRLCRFIRDSELLQPGDRVGIAVSGGADSIALLRLLLELRKELGIVLSVVHVNHKLRGPESDADAEFVSSLARAHKLQFHSTVAAVAQHAAQAKTSIETAARELRYKFFRELLGANRNIDHGFPRIAPDQSRSDPSSFVPVRGPLLNKIATAHTLDDQAETVLMRIIRGTGLRGLRSIQLRIEVEAEHSTCEIIRPLLEVRRHDLQQYLHDISQGWHEDATNHDPKFTRNRVRHLVLPLLEREFNPAVAERLAELAEIARAEEDFWDNEAAGWMGTGIHWVEAQPAATPLVQLSPRGGILAPPPDPILNALVDLVWLLSEPLAVQRRIVKAIAEHAGFTLNFRQVEEILHFATEEQRAGKELSLPDGWKVKYGEDALEFAPTEPQSARPKTANYELPLAIPGEVTIPPARSRLQAIQIEPGKIPADCDSGHLFDPTLLAKHLTVRNWRPGDRFWPEHTKAPKKIKELLQDRHVPQAERGLWPVVLSGDDVIWVRGFPGRAHMRPAPSQPAVLIREFS